MIKKLTSLVFLCFVTTICISCDNNNSITEPGIPIINSLSGNIFNWVDTSKINIKIGFPELQTFYEFGRSKINGDGTFSMELSTPSDSLTSPIIDRFRIDSSMKLEITNPDIKGIDCELHLIPNLSSSPIGRVRYGNGFENFGESYFRVSYIFSEGSISIVGADTTYENSNNFKGKQVVNYNLKLKKGWNLLVLKQLKVITSGYITTYSEAEWSNFIPSNGKWFYKID